MKQRFILPVLLTLQISVNAGNYYPAKPGEQVVPNEYIARFLPGVSAQQVLGGVAATFSVQALPALNLQKVKFAAATAQADALKLAGHPLVGYVEPNRVRKLVLAAPSDPLGSPYALTNIQAKEAWAKMPNVYLTSATASTARTKVGVIDTGIDCTHPDFKNSGGTSTDSALGGQLLFSLSHAYVNTTIAQAACPWQDDHGHGTHTAGTVAAATNNGTGVASLGYSLQVVGYKGLDQSGNGDDSTLAAAIMGAADAGVYIISASWGAKGYSQALQDAITYAWQRNTLFIAAAGNNAADELFFPAGAAHAIGVAATDPQNQPAGFSNFGNIVSIAAPGVGIISTVPAFFNASGYASLSGTSMATPHVAALAGLILTTTPNASMAAVAQRLQQSASSTNLNGAWDAAKGFGIINAYNGVTGTLRPASIGALVGQITDSANNPLAASITVNGQQVPTDATGLYRFRTLPAGKYAVTVTGTGFPTQNLSATIAPGADTVLTVAMGITYAEFTGTVKDAGVPVSGAIVQAIQQTPNGALIQGTAVTGSDGVYELWVAPGVYDLTASALSSNSATVAGQSVSAGSPTVVNLTIARFGMITGTITNSSGQVVSGAEVSVSGGGGSFGATSDSSGNYKTIALPAGTYSLTASYPGPASVTVNNISISPDANATVNVQFGPDPCLATVTPDHWKGEYYANNKTLSGTPAMVRDDGTAALSLTWGAGSPSTACGIGADNFSVRWTRTVNFTAGTYAFTTSTDDGMRLYIDGTKVQDRWADQPATPQTVNVPLSGGSHTLMVEYYENLYNASAALSWQQVGTQADFTTAVDATSRTITQGQSTTYTLTVQSTNGFSSPVNLSAINLPAGLASATWSLTPVTPAANGQASSTLTINTNAGTTTGTFTVTLRAASAGYTTKDLPVTLTINPPAGVTCTATVTPDHWKGEYYANNKTLSGTPAMVRDEGTGALNFSWGPGSPSTACGIGVDNFSVRWTRTVNFAAGTYAFTTSTDDGMRLYIDGSKVQDRWADQPATPQTVNVPLSGGTHTLMVEYYENIYDASAALSWQQVGTQADFTTGVDATSRTITQGQSTTYTLTIQSTGGFSSAVNLSAINLPAGLASATWSLSTVTPAANGQASSTLTINTNAGTATGTFTVTLRAASTGYTTKDLPVTLAINPAAGGTCVATVTPDHWKGEYYANNKTLSGTPAMVRDDGAAALSFSWGAGSPSTACGIGVDNFSVRWTRTVNFTAGTYAFTTSTDDGMRLYIDGSKVQDRWADQPATPQTVNVPLSGGTHTLMVEYYENIYDAAAALSWQQVGTQPDFTTGVDATSRTITQGQSTTYTLTVQSTGGFSSAVNLSAINLPAGLASATWSLTPVTPAANGQASSTLTINTNAGTSTGTFTVTLRAASTGYTTKDLPITLTINPAAGGTCLATVTPDHWKGEYYANNKTLSGTPAMVRDDGTAALNFSWGPGSPSTACGIGVDNFSVRWTRTVNFAAGTYAFTTSTDDGMRLYIDGSKVQDRWADQPATPQTVNVPLSGGTHTLMVEYYENIYDASAALSWQQVGAVADFTTGVDATSRTITQGQSTTYTLTIQSTSGFSSAVNLSAINLPAGLASATWSLSPVTPPANGQASSTLTINTNAGTSTGTFTVTLRAASAGYTTKDLPVTLTINPPAGVTCTATVTPDHWKGEYYANNKTLSGTPAMVRDDGAGTLSFTWGAGSPSTACGIGVDNFSVRWTRTVNFAAGTYAFTTSTDDGMRLYIDGTKVQDRWADQPATPQTVNVPLSGGTHTLMVEYYENIYDAAAALSWQPVGTP